MKAKFIILFTLSFLGISNGLYGQDLTVSGQPGAAPAIFVPSRVIQMLPADKRPLLLKTEERNPYESRSQVQTDVSYRGENVEEAQIRQRLSALSVSGQSEGSNGLRVLLGDIIIEKGRILPKLLENQTEDLQVIEVSENSVILGWLHIDTGELSEKTMTVAYDLTPSVTYALQGQSRGVMKDGSDGIAGRRMGTLYMAQERKKEQDRIAARNPEEGLSNELTEAGQ